MPAAFAAALFAALLAASAVILVWRVVVTPIKAISRRIYHTPSFAPWWPSQADLMAVGATEDIAALIATGQKINAIKSIHEEADMGLYDAKRIVDEVLAKARARRLLNAGASEPVANALAWENVAGAVRAYQLEIGVGRRAAGDYVTALLARAKA